MNWTRGTRAQRAGIVLGTAGGIIALNVLASPRVAPRFTWLPCLAVWEHSTNGFELASCALLFGLAGLIVGWGLPTLWLVFRRRGHAR